MTKARMLDWRRRSAAAALLVVALGLSGVVAANVQTRVHHIALQVNSDDPAPMKHAVSNSINLVRQYRERNEAVRVEIVACGPGISMFRADASPVREKLEYMHCNFPEIAFTVWGSTNAIIEEHERHALPLVEGTRVVPFGVVRSVESQEAA